MHYHGHRERLRKRLMDTPEALADYELLELLLGYVLLRRDTKPLAKDLLTKFGSIHGVMTANHEEIVRVNGAGPAVATLWKLLHETGARVAESPLRQRLTLSSPEAVAEMARKRLGPLAHEEIWIAYLDTQNRMLEWEKASKGTTSATMIYPRDILERALQVKASGFIMVHNHPGGSPNPSGADIELTRRIQHAAQTLHIRFVDHVVVTSESCYSLMDDALLP